MSRSFSDIDYAGVREHQNIRVNLRNRFLLDVSDEVKDAVGSDYDFAAWEPRGIGYSIPAVNNCQPPDSNLTKSKRSLDNLKIYGPNMSLEDLIDADTLNQVMKQGEDC